MNYIYSCHYLQSYSDPSDIYTYATNIRKMKSFISKIYINSWNAQEMKNGHFLNSNATKRISINLSDWSGKD